MIICKFQSHIPTRDKGLSEEDFDSIVPKAEIVSPELVFSPLHFKVNKHSFNISKLTSDIKNLTSHNIKYEASLQRIKSNMFMTHPSTITFSALGFINLILLVFAFYGCCKLKKAVREIKKLKAIKDRKNILQVPDQPQSTYPDNILNPPDQSQV